MNELIDIQKILEYLPHRYPFLLIDRVLEIKGTNENQSIIALKNVTMNESFFKGHFPNQPIMPGVLILEAMAQTAAILAYRMLANQAEKQGLCYLAGIDNARFKRIVVPGDQLHITVNIIRQRREVWKLKGIAVVENEVACIAEFLSAIKITSLKSAHL